VHLELHQRLGLGHPADGGNPLGEEIPQILVAAAYDLDVDVDPAGAPTIS
jgi:hypothetical protein